MSMTYLKVTIFMFMIVISTAMAQDKPAYELFKKNGKPAKYEKMIKDLAKSDMVFFGEYHTNPISHWLQFEMAKSFLKANGTMKRMQRNH